MKLQRQVCGALLIMSLSLTGCAFNQAPTYDEIKAESVAAPVSLAKDQKPKSSQGSAPMDLSGSLNLKQAVRLALERNPDQEAALARIMRAEALVDQAMAPFYPALSAYGGYTRGDAPSAFLFKTIDQRVFESNTNFNSPGTFQNYELGFNVRWNLFKGGRDLLQRRVAETGLGLSRLDRLSVANALVASVAKTFFNSLASAEFVEAARQSVETVASELKVMKVRQKAGGALKSDVLSLRVRLAQAKENLVTAQKNHRLALAALASLLDADLDVGFEPVFKGELTRQLPSKYGNGLKLAFSNRPELMMARKRVISARLGVDMVRAERLPTLDASATYYMAAPTLDFQTDRANWTAGLLANWDIFTGFSTKYGEKAALATLKEMLAADRKATRSVQLDVKTAYLNLEEAGARLVVSRASVAQARESLKLVIRQYQGGSASVTRYLDAELDLTRSRIRAIASRYDHEKAKVDIARSLGLWAALADGAE